MCLSPRRTLYGFWMRTERFFSKSEMVRAALHLESFWGPEGSLQDQTTKSSSPIQQTIAFRFSRRKEVIFVRGHFPNGLESIVRTGLPWIRKEPAMSSPRKSRFKDSTLPGSSSALGGARAVVPANSSIRMESMSTKKEMSMSATAGRERCRSLRRQVSSWDSPARGWKAFLKTWRLPRMDSSMSQTRNAKLSNSGMKERSSKYPIQVSSSARTEIGT